MKGGKCRRGVEKRKIEEGSKKEALQQEGRLREGHGPRKV